MAQESDSLYTDSVFRQQILDNVEIKGQRLRFKTNGTNLTVDIQNSVLKDFGTADDVLQKMPLISGQNGMYTMLGRGSAVIYVDQRKVTDGSELSHLSSSDIESIEIISNPSTQYDAEAHAVIKIKMRRPSDVGFGVRVTLFDGQSRRNSDYEYAQLTYNTQVVNAFLNFSNNSTRLSTDQENGERTQAKGTTWELINSMPRWDTYYYHQDMAAGVSIQPSANYLFGASLNYSREIDRYGGISKEQMYKDGELYENLTSKTFCRQHYDRWVFNTYYNGRWNDRWILSVNADYVKHTAGSQQTNNEEGSVIGAHTVANQSNTSHHIYATNAKLDYIISKQLQFRIGVDISHSVENKGNISQDKEKDFSQLHAEEARYAVFAECGLSLNAFSAELGLRYECFDTDYKDDILRKQIVDKTHHRFFPFISLSLPVKNMKMGLGLTTRVRRPTYYELRNSEEYLNRYSLEAGNPLLLPQYTTTLTYSLSWRNFNFSIDYQWKENYIFSKHVVRQEDPLIAVATSVNYGSCSAISSNISYNTKIGIWEPHADFNMIRTFLNIYRNDGGKISNHSPYVRLSLHNYFTLPHEWMPYVSFICNNNGCQYEGKVKSAAIMDIGVTKYMLDKSVYFRLSLNNIFGAKERIVLYNDNYEFNRTRYRDNREITLLIRYIFKNNKKYKGENAASEEMGRL